ncbi:hypothetical protein HER32_13345 [Hymenobacter sp. BT18]|uniref:hypothetical protein n=1 Tax=Hymenobacter sp. BT18 TaxID=2835648 RepID=UPI00143E9D79|nr:hypothetical protein [Hymenobacter sp. BT18]QIX62117.1 hypothetical protein HER32_13345 [Hymenobacter sp. BT18]
MWKNLLYYASFSVIYVSLSVYSAIELFAFELFGPLKENYSLWELLALPSGYWKTKLAYVIYSFLDFPFGIPLRYIKTDTVLPLVAIVLNSLFMAWLLQRVFRRLKRQRVNIVQA